MSEKHLSELRSKLDGIDDSILKKLQDREAIIKAIGILKQQGGIRIEQLDREKEIRKKRKALCAELGLDEECVEKIFDLIIKRSKKIQSEL